MPGKSGCIADAQNEPKWTKRQDIEGIENSNSEDIIQNDGFNQFQKPTKTSL